MDKSLYYILDENNNAIPVKDVLEYAKWYEQNKKRTRVDESFIDHYHISTVFLGLDHGMFDREPLIFETMVFSDIDEDENNYMERCSTWEQAAKQHESVKGRIILKQLKNEGS
jgi:hypothetical protein